MQNAEADPRIRAARLVCERTPSAHDYREYRDWAGIYLDALRDKHPGFSLRGMRIATRGMSFHPSLLFRKDYLVAWVDGEAFSRAMPGLDALVSAVTVPHPAAPILPLILAPERRRRSRSESFRSILEHEIVHVNQALLGQAIPELNGRTASKLLESFFTYTLLEYEAHFIQVARWPEKRREGTGFSLDQWALLRAHTPALEEILHGAAIGGIPGRIVPTFLDAVPKRAHARLPPDARSHELVAWFNSRWAGHVAVALGILQSKGVDVGGASLGGVRRWWRRQQRVPR